MKVLRLVKNGRWYYIPSKEDFKVVRQMGVPIVKVDVDSIPLLRKRCRQHRVRIVVRSFESLEQATYEKIKERWPFVLDLGKTSTMIEVPKKEVNFKRAESLIDALSNYYERHMYDVEVKVRRYATKIRFILERKFNDRKSPEWKKAPSRD